MSRRCVRSSSNRILPCSAMADCCSGAIGPARRLAICGSATCVRQSAAAAVTSASRSRPRSSPASCAVSASVSDRAASVPASYGSSETGLPVNRNPRCPVSWSVYARRSASTSSCSGATRVLSSSTAAATVTRAVMDAADTARNTTLITPRHIQISCRNDSCRRSDPMAWGFPHTRRSVVANPIRRAGPPPPRCGRNSDRSARRRPDPGDSGASSPRCDGALRTPGTRGRRRGCSR